MKERIPMILGCLFLAWLFPNTTEPVSTLPTDGLVEQVATVKDSLQVQPIENLEGFDQIGDATKKVEAKKEIVIFTRANCPPCDRWKQVEQPKFERAGWTVAYCDRHDFAITPHFLIEANGRKYENKGYLLFDKIDEVTK
jgi:hypothetical protein